MEEIAIDIFEWFGRYLSKSWAVFLTAWLPFAELRLAIPLGISMGLSPLKVFFLGITGNMVPVIPLLFLLKPIQIFLEKNSRLMARFFAWLEKRTYRKSDKVDRYGALGLILFTAVPLPTTGAWTASLAAILFKIKFKYAFPAILVGVLLAGIIVTLLATFTSGLFVN
ncbi:MAG: COG2426 family protein [Bacillota bacterium]